jgi:two-component system C4-dicarboxylate transport sensor histidine kinase DctB
MIAAPSNSSTGLPQRPARKPVRRLLGWSALVLCFVGVAYACYAWSMQRGIAALRASATQRLQVYEASLGTILSRHDYLPKTLELNPDVIALLERPDEPALVARANRFLEKINNQAGSNVVYVLNLRGVALASSNWRRTDSFVGVDLAFRPYVQAALNQDPGRFYAIGTTSNEAGYYFAHGIYRDGTLLGVATVKVGLDQLKKSLAQGTDMVMLVDEHGVIFLTSIPALQYKTLSPLPQATRDRLALTHQYHQQPLQPVGLTVTENFPDGAQVVAIGRAGSKAGLAGAFLMTQTSTTLQPGWRFLLLSDLGRVAANARAAAALGAATLGCLIFLGLYLRQRQLAVQQHTAAKAALQQAYDNLEVMVAERTAALEATTRELTEEIDVRHQAERTLRTTQDELIQAGKMAVLGQMSAGITHELNQPLTALRTMSDNAVILLERGRLDDASKNLGTISRLVENMATITRQLKVFARKGTSVKAPVSLRNAIKNALFLVERRIELEQVRLELQIPDGDVVALGDSNRLEQVLVNLFNNALDSMAGVDHPCLFVAVRRAQDRVVVAVSDNGAGLSDEVAGHLFEPFFTTKEQGAGLGLGLVISAQIVREFGGSLNGKNGPQGGAEFTIDLPATQDGAAHA